MSTSADLCTLTPDINVRVKSGVKLRIGEVARLGNVSVRSLRYYEEQGLIESTRTSSDQREYDADAVDRVALIQQLFSAGLTSKSIRMAIPAVQSGTCGPELVAELEEHRRQIRERIEQLESAAVRLDRVIGMATYEEKCVSDWADTAR
jgi:DNA-binding transcriptional MerR regulator